MVKKMKNPKNRISQKPKIGVVILTAPEKSRSIYPETAPTWYLWRYREELQEGRGAQRALRRLVWMFRKKWKENFKEHSKVIRRLKWIFRTIRTNRGSLGIDNRHSKLHILRFKHTGLVWIFKSWGETKMKEWTIDRHPGNSLDEYELIRVVANLALKKQKVIP